MNEPTPPASSTSPPEYQHYAHAWNVAVQISDRVDSATKQIARLIDTVRSRADQQFGQAPIQRIGDHPKDSTALGRLDELDATLASLAHEIARFA